MDWWPRHTPSIGSLPAKYLMASREMPASVGVHGPGETTMRSGFRASISATGQLIVAHDLDFGTELAQVLHNVVGKGIVVIDHQQHVGSNLLNSLISNDRLPRE